MAVKYEEVDILGEGIEYATPTKGTFALNMLRRQGAWEVRQGFGQLAEFDTLMPFAIGPALNNSSRDWGYKAHIGSYALQTDFGHTQIVSVFTAIVYSDEASGYEPIPSTTADTYGGQIEEVYLVDIYDVTTGERWEEPIYTHTSESGVSERDMPYRLGNYETNLQKDAQSWRSAYSTDPCFFAEVGDTLYFGTKSMPLYAYSPCTFRGNRHRECASFRDGTHGDGGSGGATARPEWAGPYSESSMVWRVRPSNGQYPETYNYRTSSTLPQPEALIAYEGALVIANERVLYFSNIFEPTVFIDQNIVIVPTEKEITALGRAGQNIYIFTDTETWAYAPGAGDLLGEGMAPVRISDSMGCINQNTTTNYGEALIWVSRLGVHVASGGFDIQTISGPIEPLFTDFITDPSTTFFTATTANTGAATYGSSAPQRNSVVTLETSMVNVTYCDHLRALLVTLPEQRATLCFSDDQWSLWSYESNTVEASDGYGGTAPYAAQNIHNPWMLSIEQRLFCIGSVQADNFSDDARTKSYSWSETTTARSFYIMEYGRGGAIDRSVDDEDFRMISGKYRIDWSNTSLGVFASTTRSAIVFDKWIPVEPQYLFWGAGAAGPTPNGESAPAAPEVTYLVPVKIIPAKDDFDLINSATFGINIVRVRFAFDNTHWQPIFIPGTTNIDLQLPPERMSSRRAWTTHTCLDSTAGYAASVDGDVVSLIWDGVGGGAWEGDAGGTHEPVAATSGGMNVAPYRENILCYIPMKTRSGSYPSVDGMSQMGITSDSGGLAIIDNNRATPASVILGAYIWQQWARFPRHREDIQGSLHRTPIAQPVDWAYMGPDIALNSDTRVKLRGLAATMLSRGQGTDVVNSWTQGLFNTMLAADLKSWMAQVVDYIGGVATFRRPVSITTNLYPTPRTDETIRDRIPEATPSQQAEFGGGVQWGTSIPFSTTFEADTCLIGDEEVDTIVTSSSVKGTSASAMLFGFMRNPAERLKFSSVKALFRVVAQNRRRKGR